MSIEKDLISNPEKAEIIAYQIKEKYELREKMKSRLKPLVSSFIKRIFAKKKIDFYEKKIDELNKRIEEITDQELERLDKFDENKREREKIDDIFINPPQPTEEQNPTFPWRPGWKIRKEIIDQIGALQFALQDADAKKKQIKGRIILFSTDRYAQGEEEKNYTADEIEYLFSYLHINPEKLKEGLIFIKEGKGYILKSDTFPSPNEEIVDSTWLKEHYKEGRLRVSCWVIEESRFSPGRNHHFDIEYYREPGDYGDSEITLSYNTYEWPARRITSE
ncbi:MAG: hypothetical protein ACP5PR_00325 [Minisyncoccia bacterium]